MGVFQAASHRSTRIVWLLKIPIEPVRGSDFKSCFEFPLSFFRPFLKYLPKGGGVNSMHKCLN